MNFKFIFNVLVLGSLAFAINAQSPVTSPFPFNTPEFQEFSPTVSGDGKTLIFQSNRNGNFGLYETVLQKDGSWSTPKAITSLNGVDKEANALGGPCLSRDGNTLYFCALRSDGLGDMDIYMSKRKSNGEWGSADNLGSVINTAENESFPSVSPDGKKIFFTRKSKGGDKPNCFKVFYSEQDDNGRWQSPKEMGMPVNTSCDKAPRVIYDNQNLFYCTEKSGQGYDVYRTKLNSDGTWANPVAMSFLNTSESEAYAALQDSEEKLFFSKNGDIFISEVPLDMRLHGLSLYGTVVDEESLKPLAAKMFWVDSLNKDTISLATLTADGQYRATLGVGKRYKLMAMVDRYYPYVTEEFAPTVNEDFRQTERMIKMKPKRREVIFKVKDAENNKGLKVKIKVTNAQTKEEMWVDANAGRDGNYALNLREGNKYNIEVSSVEGYAFTSTEVEVPLSSTAENIYASNGRADTTKPAAFVPDFDIKVQPLKDNTKLTLKDIYFDFNKVTLRDESYAELDRVLNLLTQNPSARIEIAAHTDDVGGDESNMRLSERRAQEIVRYLKSKGINANRMVPKGYGESRPVVNEQTEEARAKNRRVELKIIDIN